MPSKFLLCALILCVCLANCFGLNLNSKEKREFHRLFKVYNKPAVKVIKTIHGDTYNCVDFYKQPAFDHPLLKNHSYHSKFSSSRDLPSNIYQTSSQTLKFIWANGQGCPEGTIPIRKYTKKQFIHTHKLFQKLFQTDLPVEGLFRSSVHTHNGPFTFYGGSGIFNYHNFQIDISQYTSGYLIVKGGNDQLQFGWMINPEVYGDGLTRLFLKTKVRDTYCFNLICPGGYIHTNKDVPIDAVLPTYPRGINTLESEFKILKDFEKNTWQLHGTFGTSNTLYGYWPNELFKGLKGAAEYLEWGGEAYNPLGLIGPGMGSGFFPEHKFDLDGYAKKLFKYDNTGKNFDVAADETEVYTDDRNLYNVLDVGYIDENVGHCMFYGGPGKQ